MKHCNCLHPHIILNPLTPELISRFKHYFMKKKEYYEYVPRMFNFPYSKFSPKKNHVTLDTLDDYIIVDDVTGEFYNIYMSVPCGKCELCKNSKIQSFVHRCKLESQCYDSLPWFCTLTYDNAHVPIDGLSIRDVQLFFKRFRINLLRHGFSDKIRYVVVGEYGKNTHRPHYHLLIWNVNSKSSQQYNEVSYLLQKSWSKGFIMHRLVNLNDDKGFFYTSKYLKKDGFVPKGCNKMFCNSSRKNGGIGAPFLDSIKDDVRKRLSPHYKIRNKWSDEVFELRYSRYVIDRLFPTFCRAVPKVLRDGLRDFVQFFGFLKYRFSDVKPNVVRRFSKLMEQYHALFSKDFYLGSTQYNSLSRRITHNFPCGDYNYCYEDLCYFLRNLSHQIANYLPRFPDLSLPREVERRRNVLLGKLFLVQHDIDLNQRAYEIRRSFALASAREIL